MKFRKQFVTGLIVSVWVATASAQFATNYNFAFTPDRVVPDGNTSGLSLSTNLTGIFGDISSLTVSLNVTNGYNGDLFAYLAGPNGGFAVLLNRTGRTNGNAFGFGDPGFNVTFNDSASFTNIHFYQDYAHALDANGALLGTWVSDGRAIDPLSDPSVFSTNVPSAFLDSFEGTNPNGTWTLYLADLSNGGESTVNGWGLNITTIPEPTTSSLFAIGIAIVLARRRMKR